MQHPLRHCQPININWPVISGQSEEFRGDSRVPRIGLLIGPDSDSVSRWWWWWCLDAGGSPRVLLSLSTYLSIYLPHWLSIGLSLKIAVEEVVATTEFLTLHPVP